jgi:hypothetical protein
MHVRVMAQGLPPGVKQRHHADLGAQMLGVRGDRAQRLGRRLEQKVVDHRLVVEGDLGGRRGQGEDDVEVLRGEQVGLPIGEPVRSREALTLRAMAVAAGVVGLPHQPAVQAMFDMAAERRRPAGLYGAHYLALAASQMTVVTLAVGAAVAAEHVRHLQGGPHAGGRSTGRHDLQDEPIERTDGSADHVVRHLGVAGGGREIVVPQQHLDDADISARFQQVGGEAVPQGVHSHPLAGTVRNFVCGRA